MGIPRRIRRLGLLTTITVALSAASAEAYELDSTFGGDGVITTDGGANESDNFFDVEVLPSGKMLAAGRTNTVAGGQDFLLVKYNADGTLDTSFGGGDGIVATDFGGASTDVARGLDVQGDGKIVLAGNTQESTIGATQSFALARYNSDGTLDDDSNDAGFGGDGLQIVSTSSGYDAAYDVLVDGSGRIVAVGDEYVAATDEFDSVVVRLTSAGALDTAFDGDGGSGNGVVRIDITGALGADYSLAVALFDDGDIAAGGGAYDDNTSDDDPVLVRLNAADGTLDDSFDNDGKVVTDAGNYIEDLAVSPGKILSVGQDDGNDWQLARYEQSDGSLDESFDGDGLLTTIFPGQNSANPQAVAIDGARYVVAGTVSLGADGQRIGAARYHGSGSLDSDFGGDGLFMADLGSVQANGVGIVDDGNALTDNRVVIGGSLFLGEQVETQDALLLRLGPDETAPASDITKPGHRKAYRPGKIRTLTGTASDPNDGSGVDEVEVALRRKRNNGSCAWWDGDSFAGGACSTQAFVDAAGAEDWSYTLPSNLKSSVGTKTKNYTLYSRASDLADNTETSLETGRNANTFDVR